MSREGWGRFSLSVRVLLLLSLALLPLGAIGFWQTQRLADEVGRQTQSALVQATRTAMLPFQAAIQRAYGATQALAPTLRELHDDPRACAAAMGEFQKGTPYVYVGFVEPDGMMRCASDGRTFDFSGFPSFQATQETEARSVVRNPNAPLSGSAVLIVTDVMRDTDGALLGYLSLSLPEIEVSQQESPPGEDRALSLLTFNDRGELLSSTEAEGELAQSLPEDRNLAQLVETPMGAFLGIGRDGVERYYARIPVVPDVAYALSSWERGLSRTSWLDDVVLTALMPILMWLATVLVAVLALERLLSRHVRTLGRQMRAFARSRRMVSQPMLVGAGSELEQIEADFRNMADSILQDEARLEDNLREKNILLKEVHHRVKNNLQLISSIMNMQARRLESPEARAVLRRVQDRVSGLAAVHRSLYQTEDIGRIDAGVMVADLARQIAASAPVGQALDLRVETEGITLDADRSVALSLAVSEIMTNAVLHTAPLEGRVQDRWIEFHFHRSDEECARLSVANPRDPEAGPLAASGNAGAQTAAGGGLGLQLIRAFAQQLDGKVDHNAEAGRFEIVLEFPLEAERDAPRDY